MPLESIFKCVDPAAGWERQPALVCTLRRFWEQNTTDRDGFIRGTELQAPKHHSHYQVGFLQAIMPFSPAVRAESHPLLHQRAELEAYDDGDDDMDEYDVSD